MQQRTVRNDVIYNTDKTSLKADREVGGGEGEGRADSVYLFRNL